MPQRSGDTPAKFPLFSDFERTKISLIFTHTMRFLRTNVQTGEAGAGLTIFCVKRILDHRNIQNTLIYIDLESAIFRTTNDEFTVRAANSVEDACKLIEVGFECVTGEYDDGGKILRKQN